MESSLSLSSVSFSLDSLRWAEDPEPLTSSSGEGGAKTHLNWFNLLPWIKPLCHNNTRLKVTAPPRPDHRADTVSRVTHTEAFTSLITDRGEHQRPEADQTLGSEMTSESKHSSLRNNRHVFRNLLTPSCRCTSTRGLEQSKYREFHNVDLIRKILFCDTDVFIVCSANSKSVSFKIQIY